MVKSEGEGLGIAIYNLVRAHRHAKKKRILYQNVLLSNILEI
jgi:hypothetical protein